MSGNQNSPQYIRVNGENQPKPQWIWPGDYPINKESVFIYNYIQIGKSRKECAERLGKSYAYISKRYQDAQKEIISELEKREEKFIEAIKSDVLTGDAYVYEVMRYLCREHYERFEDKELAHLKVGDIYDYTKEVKGVADIYNVGRKAFSPRLRKEEIEALSWWVPNPYL